MDIVQSLGQRIKQLRKQQGFSQAHLAEKASLSTNFLGTVERGIKSPSVMTLERIAKALAVKVSDLFLFPKEEEKLDEMEMAIQQLTKYARNLNPKQVRLLARFIKNVSKKV